MIFRNNPPFSDGSPSLSRSQVVVKNHVSIGIDARVSSGEARPFMSKPALGRGLASLLGRPGQIPERDASGDDGGVQLLLRGTDGTELLPPPIPMERPDTRPLLPRWALGGILVLDAGLVGLAGWIALGPGYVERLIIAALMVCMGGVLLAMAVYLRGQTAVEELNSLNPIAEEKPRIRVQFLDESSGHRPGKA